jgi:hypothetical protein
MDPEEGHAFPLGQSAAVEHPHCNQPPGVVTQEWPCGSSTQSAAVAQPHFLKVLMLETQYGPPAWPAQSVSVVQPHWPIPGALPPISSQSGPSEFCAQSVEARQGRQSLPEQTPPFWAVQSASVTHSTQNPLLGSQTGAGMDAPPMTLLPTQSWFELQPHR